MSQLVQSSAIATNNAVTARNEAVHKTRKRCQD